MITDLKPYPTMKDSGVEWLGAVPEHWEVTSGRSCFFEKKQSNVGLIESTVLSLSYGKIVIKPEEKLYGLVPASFETYQLIEVGDIICRPTDLQNDKKSLRFGFSKHYGIITSAYICLDTRPKLDNYFAYLLLHTYDLKKIIYRLGSGLRQNLAWDDFKSLPCLAPPIPEQTAIVRFLDYMDGRIRKYIRAKEKLIELLEEQKQAIIHQAVTRGLDPNVPLKNSGLIWTENIPEHWSTSRLGLITTRIGDGLHGTPVYVDESIYRFVNGNNLTQGKVQITQNTRCVSKDEYEKHTRPIDETTVLLSINGTIGNVAYYSGESIILGKSASYINCGDNLSRKYLFFLLQSPEVINLFQREATGTTILNLSLETIRQLPTLLPPFVEQAEIAAFLERRTSQLRESIRRVKHEIDLLREYHTRLIADVVTGKLDVREVAANLPEESDEPAPLDETDAMPEALDLIPEETGS